MASRIAVLAFTKMLVLLRETALSRPVIILVMSVPPALSLSAAALSSAAVSSAAASAAACTPCEDAPAIATRSSSGYSPKRIVTACEKSRPSPMSIPSKRPSIVSTIMLVRNS